LAKKRSKRQAAEEPSFEQALEQLGEIVHQLEEGEIGLDGALEQYEKGVRLLGQCYRLLETAQRRIELLSGVDADGRPVLTPMDEPTPSLAEKAAGHGRPTQGLSGPPERGGPAAETEVVLDFPDSQSDARYLVCHFCRIRQPTPLPYRRGPGRLLRVGRGLPRPIAGVDPVQSARSGEAVAPDAGVDGLRGVQGDHRGRFARSVRRGDGARLFPDTRRPAGDGRRRSPPRAAYLSQEVRRGRGHPGRRRPAGAGI